MSNEERVAFFSTPRFNEAIKEGEESGPEVCFTS